MVHHLKKKISSGNGEMAIKIDINKAYDRMDWSFLELLLLKLGISEQWTRWIMLFVTSHNCAIFYPS